MSHADAGDASLHYVTSGEGTGILLLLPQSSGPEGRRALLEGLSRAHRVIAYDQRGTGASSSWAEPMSMQDQARDANTVLTAAGAGRAHLLCHSTGCGIGIAFAGCFPERVASLVLLNPWTHGDPYLESAQRLRIALAHALNPEDYARYNAALLFPPEYRRQQAAGFAAAFAAARHAPHDAHAIERRLEAILAFDARDQLPKLTSPSIVIAAADDQLMPSWFATQASELLPNSRLEVLPGGGHMLTETRPDTLLSRLLPWFAEVDSGAANRATGDAGSNDFLVVTNRS